MNRTGSIAIACAVLLCGCANFKVVSEFAAQTGDLTATVRTELRQLDRLCRRHAEQLIVVNDMPDDAPLRDCERHQAAYGRLAGVTVDVLDDYAKALESLADGKALDLSPGLRKAGRELETLEGKGGKAIVAADEVAALTKVARVLAGLATLEKREEAVKRLIEERAALATGGRLLRSFFVDDPAAPPGRMKAPYANLAGIALDSVRSTEKSLQTPALRKAEPIRSRELLRDVQRSRKLLEARAGGAPDSVPATIAAAIDAWLAALDRFTEDAIVSEPQDFRNQLAELRAKADAARDAVRNAVRDSMRDFID